MGLRGWLALGVVILICFASAWLAAMAFQIGSGVQQTGALLLAVVLVIGAAAGVFWLFRRH